MNLFGFELSSNATIQDSEKEKSDRFERSIPEKLYSTEPNKFYDAKNSENPLKFTRIGERDKNKKDLNLFDLKNNFIDQFKPDSRKSALAFEIVFRKLFADFSETEVDPKQKIHSQIRNKYKHRFKNLISDVEQRYNLDNVFESLQRKINALDFQILEKTKRNFKIKQKQQLLRNEINELKNYPFNLN